MTLSCLCGSVLVHVESKPDHINECNCSFCRAAGARWAYFHPSQVTIAGVTAGYRRNDKDRPNADLRFCPTCGTTTHFALTEQAVAQFGDRLVGVNMRLADEADLAGIELRFPDGRRWSGTGPFGDVRAALIIGEG